MIVPLIYRDLKAEPGFRAKAIFFGIMKSLSVAVPFATKWAIVGSLWAWPIGLTIMTAAVWTFGATFLVGMLLGQTIFRREHAVALNMIYTTLAMWAGAAAIIVRIVRWFL